MKRYAQCYTARHTYRQNQRSKPHPHRQTPRESTRRVQMFCGSLDVVCYAHHSLHGRNETTSRSILQRVCRTRLRDFHDLAKHFNEIPHSPCVGFRSPYSAGWAVARGGIAYGAGGLENQSSLLMHLTTRRKRLQSGITVAGFVSCQESTRLPPISLMGFGYACIY